MSKKIDFFKQLQKELPSWVAKGWIKPEYEQSILADAAKTTELNEKSTTVYFSFMGIVLLGAGIITFFAAHWTEISKLSKLIILLSSLWASYLAAYYFLKQNQSYLNRLGQLLTLLGTLIFGVNIWLITQIYHFDVQDPAGILIWSLGAWMVAILLKNPFCMALSIVLALIWSLIKSPLIQHIHWSFLLIWALNLIPLLKEKWRGLLHLELISLIIWASFNLFWFLISSVHPQYYLFYISCSLLLAWLVFNLTLPQFQFMRNNMKKTFQHYAALFLLLNLFYLTFPDLLITFKQAPHKIWPGTLILILCNFSVLCIGLNSNKLCNLSKTSIGFYIGVLLVLSTLLLLNHIPLNPSIMGILYNLTMISILGWFIHLGYKTADRAFINLSFLFFAALILARYFDIFWTLLNRSLFFIMGGLLLIIGSYLFETQRRRLTLKMNTQKAENPKC